VTPGLSEEFQEPRLRAFAMVPRMDGSTRWSSLLSFVFVWALAGCADDGPTQSSETPTGGTAGAAGEGGSSATGGSAGSGGDGGCTVIEPIDTMLYFGSFASFALSARIDAPLPGYAKTRLALELYDEGSGLPAGSFDLSQAPDDSYATCEHCVLLVAYDEVGQARRVFFQQSGSMKLDKLEWEDALAGAGSVSSVKLVEVTQALDGSWHEVVGGGCYELPSWSFDTTPVNGGDCNSAEDCPNEAVQVCDVETKKCVTAECSLTFDPPFCDEGQRCMSQIGSLIERDEGGSAAGACYVDCSPASSGACGAGETCFPLGPTQEAGICLPVGGPAVGEPCTPSDLATSCAEGAFCTGDPPRCQKACNYLSPPAGCPNGAYCSQINLCEPLAVGDLAPVGAQCEAASPLLRDCGPEGDMFRGLCIDWFPEAGTKTCERICKLDGPVCGPNQTCIPMFSNPSIGVCHTNPTCGDKLLDLIGGELCDDGNTQSGDGCSADCKTAELDALCSKAEPLVMGVDFDSNENGHTGYASLCDPYIANPAKLYSFMPSAPGKLTLELDSAANLGISVLSDCADAQSELACKLEPGKDTLHVNFTSVPAKPVLVTVRAAYPLATGSFALAASFVPAVCGDGQVGGAEVCDDGNNAGNDGCSADCSTIEWAALCSALPPLSLDTKLQGNVDSGTQYFDTSGHCAYQSGRERAYSFTASAAGTLQLTLTSTENLNIAVLEGCGPFEPDKLLSCSNSGWAGETETIGVAVTAGQKLTVLVQGHSSEAGGSYELTAKLGP
jgi:cysteine-rich repeat protein